MESFNFFSGLDGRTEPFSLVAVERPCIDDRVPITTDVDGSGFKAGPAFSREKDSAPDR